MAVTLERDSQELAPEVEALFPEAKQLERHRRLRIGGAVLAAVLVSALVALGLSGGGSARNGGLSPTSATPPPLSASGFAHVVNAATLRVRSASFAVISREDDEVGCYRAGSNPFPIYKGVVSFVGQADMFRMSDTKCSTPAPSWQVQVGDKLYDEVGSKVFEQMAPAAQKADPLRADGHDYIASVLIAVRLNPTLPVSQAEFLYVLGSRGPLAFLNSLTGSLRKIGTATISGMPVTEYRGMMTLGTVQRAIASAGLGTSNPTNPRELVPPENSITIPATVWIDRGDRLVRFESVEPLFTAMYRKSQVAPQSSPFYGQSDMPQVSEVAPHDSTLASYSRAGFDRFTLSLSNFGVRVHIVIPKPSRPGRPAGTRGS